MLNVSFTSFSFLGTYFFNTEDASFHISSHEERGRFVGMIENVSHGMTFKILNSSTNKINNRSNVRSINDNEHLNLRANPPSFPKVIVSLRDNHFEDEDSTSETNTENGSSTSSSTKHILVVDPQDLVRRNLYYAKKAVNVSGLASSSLQMILNEI